MFLPFHINRRTRYGRLARLLACRLFQQYSFTDLTDQTKTLFLTWPSLEEHRRALAMDKHQLCHSRVFVKLRWAVGSLFSTFTHFEFGNQLCRKQFLEYLKRFSWFMFTFYSHPPPPPRLSAMFQVGMISFSGFY